MKVPTGHPNGGAQKAGTVGAKESDFQQRSGGPLRRGNGQSGKGTK